MDLDNHWSYLRTHGEPSWRELPSYVDVLVPRLLRFLGDRSLTITVFLVGLDCAQDRHREALATVAEAGHEIGNHSYRHEPWLHLYSRDELEGELEKAEAAIEAATGVRPLGFRGPGFSLSKTTLEVLSRRGYRYDASTLPTFIGPLARLYYLRSARIADEQRRRRAALFGKFRDGLRPLRPYQWEVGERTLLEIPVTTMPITRMPIHISYLLYLSLYSPAVARCYFRTALRLCRLSRIEPSVLLHPLDFLGGDDIDGLGFFPAMGRPGSWKLEMTGRFMSDLAQRFEIVPIKEQVEAAALDEDLPRRRPRE